MATEVSSPLAGGANVAQLKSVQKAMSLPTVEAAVDQVAALYTRVKGLHSILEWALTAAESGAGIAATVAAGSGWVAVGDEKAAEALDALQKRVPIVTKQPQEIVHAARQALLDKVSPHVNKVCAARSAATQRVQSLKQLSWQRANSLLTTPAGQRAVQSLDNGAALAMQLLDRYLPPQGDHTISNDEQQIAQLSSQPAQHAAQTVQRLSAEAARRVWGALAQRLYNSGVQLDVRRYVTALLAALHLAVLTQPAAAASAAPAAPSHVTSPTAPSDVTSPAPPSNDVTAMAATQAQQEEKPNTIPAPTTKPQTEQKTNSEGKSKKNHSPKPE